MFAPSEPIHSVLSFPLLPGKPKSDHLISYSNKNVVYVSCNTDSNLQIQCSVLSLLCSASPSQFLCLLQLLLLGRGSCMHNLCTFLQNLLSRSTSGDFLLFLTTQPPRSVSISHPSLSYCKLPVCSIGLPNHFVATHGFFSCFSNLFFFFFGHSLRLTIHPKSEFMFEKF